MKMKKYRKIQEVMVWKWEGDNSLIDEMNKDLIPFNEDICEKFEVFADGDILILSHKINNSTSNCFVQIGEYVVLDLAKEVVPFNCYDEKWLNKEYIEIK